MNPQFTIKTISELTKEEQPQDNFDTKDSNNYNNLMMKITIALLSLGLVALIGVALANPNPGDVTVLIPRELDVFSTGTMMEEGQMRAAAPQCKGDLGWVYHKGFCYMFTSYHVDFLKAEELCNEHDSYLADILSNEENTFITNVLNQINPKDGTDYWIGGLDADRNKGLQWMTGQPMTFSRFVKDNPNGNPYLHMNFDNGFAWDTKDDANDKDNGFICKKIAPAA